MYIGLSELERMHRPSCPTGGCDSLISCRMQYIDVDDDSDSNCDL